MEKIINMENLHSFACVNDTVLVGKPRGIVLDFHGLGLTSMANGEINTAKNYGEMGILYVMPYDNPWSWMNAEAVALVDEIIDVLIDRYGELPIVSSGGSMGGLSSLVYTAYAKRTPVACVANCPVCDAVYHYTERPDLPKTFYSALKSYDGTLEDALKLVSPYHLAEKMPHIHYTFVHCTIDTAVNLEAHSEKMVNKLRSLGHEVDFIIDPGRGHCSLSPCAKLLYDKAILAPFGIAEPSNPYYKK